MIPKKVIVVGAGPAGLTAAWHLANQGHHVTVLERDPQYVGGLSRTVRWREFRFDIGGHRFFSKNSEIMRWWRERLGNDFVKVPRLSRIIYRRRLFHYPLKPGNALMGLGVFTSIHCLWSYLWRRLRPIKPEKSFENWVINRFGDKLYQIFFRTYTEKVWGIPCTAISADWASQRIKGLSLGKAIWNALGGGTSAKSLIEEFDYPRHGPGMMWERAQAEIIQKGGRVLLDRRVVELKLEGARVTTVLTETSTGQREQWDADDFIVTMPLAECVGGLGAALPEDARVAASQLTYRAFIVVVLIIKRTDLFPDNWIYVHSPEVRVGRIQNLNNWGRHLVSRPGVTCLEMEYFCNQGDSVWCLDDESLMATARRELESLKLAKSSEVLEGCVVREGKAYPVYDENYQSHVKVIRAALDRIENLQVAGRNGMHKYNNQDHSMLTGRLAAENIGQTNATRHFDVWRVNTDAEYQEVDEKKSPDGS